MIFASIYKKTGSDPLPILLSVHCRGRVKPLSSSDRELPQLDLGDLQFRQNDPLLLFFFRRQLKEIAGLPDFFLIDLLLASQKALSDRWNAELESILNSDGNYTGKQIAEKIAASLQSRAQLLRLLSMNNFDMEANSREEMLTSFKRAYGRSLDLFRSIIEKYCTEMSAEEVNAIMYVFFPFMFGIYPYAEVTEKQKKAMEEAEVDYKYQTIYEITYNCLSRLLNK